VVWGFVAILPILAVPAVNQRVNQLFHPIRPVTVATSTEVAHRESPNARDNEQDRSSEKPAGLRRQTQADHKTRYLSSVEPVVAETMRTEVRSSQLVTVTSPTSGYFTADMQTVSESDHRSVAATETPASSRLPAVGLSKPERRGATKLLQQGLETDDWPDQSAAGFDSDSASSSADGMSEFPREGAVGSSKLLRSPLWEPARVMAIQERLKELGARYLILENLRDRQLYRFHCRVDVGDHAVYARVFESYDAQPQRAMERVLVEVEDWMAAQRDSTARNSPDQVRPSP
jgi:hypothetical protein